MRKNGEKRWDTVEYRRDYKIKRTEFKGCLKSVNRLPLTVYRKCIDWVGQNGYKKNWVQKN
jgi:hypothetical protein